MSRHCRHGGKGHEQVDGVDQFRGNGTNQAQNQRRDSALNGNIDAGMSSAGKFALGSLTFTDLPIYRAVELPSRRQCRASWDMLLPHLQFENAKAEQGQGDIKREEQRGKVNTQHFRSLPGVRGGLQFVNAILCGA